MDKLRKTGEKPKKTVENQSKPGKIGNTRKTQGTLGKTGENVENQGRLGKTRENWKNPRKARKNLVKPGITVGNQ